MRSQRPNYVSGSLLAALSGTAHAARPIVLDKATCMAASRSTWVTDTTGSNAANGGDRRSMGDDRHRTLMMWCSKARYGSIFFSIVHLDVVCVF
jgi:hypothetical protein